MASMGGQDTRGDQLLARHGAKVMVVAWLDAV